MTSVPFKSELCDSSIFSAFPGPSTPRPISQVSFLSKGSKLILHYQVLMKSSLNLFFLVLLPFNHSLLVSKVQMGNKYSKQADQSVSGLVREVDALSVEFTFPCFVPFPASCTTYEHLLQKVFSKSAKWKEDLHIIRCTGGIYPNKWIPNTCLGCLSEFFPKSLRSWKHNLLGSVTAHTNLQYSGKSSLNYAPW